MSSKINWIALFAAFSGGFLLACILLDFAILEGKFSWWGSFREWIGALSGWIAAIGAIAVGVPTIQHLGDQNRAALTDKKLEEIEQIETGLKAIKESLSRLKFNSSPAKVGSGWFLQLYLQIESGLEKMPIHVRTKTRQDINLTNCLEMANLSHLGTQKTTHVSEDPWVAESCKNNVIRSCQTLSEALTSESERLWKWKQDRLNG